MNVPKWECTLGFLRSLFSRNDWTLGQQTIRDRKGIKLKWLPRNAKKTKHRVELFLQIRRLRKMSPFISGDTFGKHEIQDFYLDRGTGLPSKTVVSSETLCMASNCIPFLGIHWGTNDFSLAIANSTISQRLLATGYRVHVSQR